MRAAVPEHLGDLDLIGELARGLGSVRALIIDAMRTVPVRRARGSSATRAGTGGVRVRSLLAVAAAGRRLAILGGRRARGGRTAAGCEHRAAVNEPERPRWHQRHPSRPAPWW